eukprot:g258.t1
MLQRYFRRRKKRRRRDDERRRRELVRRQKLAQVRRDDDKRMHWSYRLRAGLGNAPLLPSDTGGRKEAKIRQQVLWQPSIGRKGLAAISKIRRGVGADARLPGLVKVRKGDDVAYTTEDLTHLLQRGDCIRIGPSVTFRIPGSNNERLNGITEPQGETEAAHDRKSSRSEDEGESESEDPRKVRRPRPFTKSILPLDEWWYGDDATLHIYFVQDNAMMAQCPPETAMQEIDARIQAWHLKQNPRKPTAEQLERAAERQRVVELKDAGPGAESDAAKAERLKHEKAVLEARRKKMKNRRALRLGGKNARKHKMKSLKRAKERAARAESEAESARQVYMQGNSDDEDN